MIFRTVGILLMLFSSSMLPPLVISVVATDGAQLPFFIAWLVNLFTGLGLWALTRHRKGELRFRDGFLIVVLFWFVLAAFGTVPFMLTENPVMSLSQAFFESMSGLTTTGATVLTGIDDLPLSIRYYRQQLQWLGGMGIVVLAVAIMPMLGIGGMQMYRAETPGPIKESKLTPRIKESAKALWYIYLFLTVVCALCYRIAGMDWFDAIGHSFSTIAIGGFSTHDASLGHFNSPAIALVAVFFMIVAAINFSLHFMAFRRRSLSLYLKDTEVRVLIGLLAMAGILAVAVNIAYQTFDTTWGAIWNSIFHVVSIATTTGFTIDGFSWWPSALPILLLMMSTIGGCAGSTAGGIKVMRAVLLFKQGRREISQLVHPNAILPIKIGRKPVPDRVIAAVWGFFSLYVFSYGLLSLALTATGVDLLTAFSAVSACLNNLGPGLGAVSENYGVINARGMWILSFTMLLGRLELFTLLVIFSRTFWRN